MRKHLCAQKPRFDLHNELNCRPGRVPGGLGLHLSTSPCELLGGEVTKTWGLQLCPLPLPRLPCDWMASGALSRWTRQAYPTSQQEVLPPSRVPR